MSKKILKVAGYCRVSHDEQKKFGYSIDAQVETIQKWAADKKHNIVNIYIDEGYSASNMNRPQLQEMLTRLHEVDAIVFTRLDRLSRNVLEANKILELLKKNDVDMIATSEDNVDTTTANGIFLFNLKVNLAEHELNKGSERIKAVFDYKVKNGQPISGAVPYGYKIATVDGTKRVVKDEATRPIVEDIFDYFLTHQSIHKTVVYINDKYNLKRCYETYSKLLKKEFYYGSYRGNDNFAEPYIDRDTFDRIQDILKSNIRVKKRSFTYLFTGLVKCVECGRTMTGFETTYKNKHYFYYRCEYRYSDHQCDNTILAREQIIETYLLENLEQLFKNRMLEIAELENSDRDDTKAKIKSLKVELENLNYMFMKKRIDVKTYDRLYEQTEAEIKKLNDNAPKRSNTTLHRDFLTSGWRNIYDGMTRENKRVFWRGFIKEIRTSTDNKHVYVDFL
jgi:DNA invertase Pin-like site-specific DNA recombinase